MAVIGLLLAITVGAVYVGAAVVARHRAQAAADMAALAGATVMPAGPETACQKASAVGQAMGGAVTNCSTDDLDVVVTVAVPPGVGVGMLGSATAIARAGPAEAN